MDKSGNGQRLVSDGRKKLRLPDKKPDDKMSDPEDKEVSKTRWCIEACGLCSRGVGRASLTVLAGIVLFAVFVTMTPAETVNSDAIYVIDGDTIDLNGQRFRLVGFDTPETYRSKCAYEKALGDEVTRRMQE